LAQERETELAVVAVLGFAQLPLLELVLLPELVLLL
jgi:hypothetical protein